MNMHADRDHDLLIRLETKLDQAITDIKELKDGTARRLDKLESIKADKSDVEQHGKDVERRLRRLERFFWVAIGGVTVLQFVLTLIR